MSNIPFLIPKGFRLVAKTDHMHSVCEAYFNPDEKQFFFKIQYAPDDREWGFGPIPYHPGLYECIMITFRDVFEAKGLFTYLE